MNHTPRSLWVGLLAFGLSQAAWATDPHISFELMGCYEVGHDTSAEVESTWSASGLTDKGYVRRQTQPPMSSTVSIDHFVLDFRIDESYGN